MSELRKIRIAVALLVSILLPFASASGQTGAGTSHSPYSIFGPGNLVPEGTSYNKGMGGVGLAMRNRRMINIMNPAAVTARDSLAFMADFSLYQQNRMYRQDDIKSASNLTNFNDLAISFPIYRSSAMMVGVAPYSGLGYQFASYETDPQLIAQTSAVGKTSVGTGGLYQLFIAGGVTFWKRLSLGAEYIHYFGSLQKTNTITFSQSGYNGVSSGFDMVLRANTAKFGLQFEQPVGNGVVIGVGATYKLDAPMSGSIKDYKISTGSLMSDTLSFVENDFSKTKAYFAGEWGAGLTVRQGERWRAEVDYLTSSWSRSGIDNVAGFSNVSSIVFSTIDTRSIRAGFEFVPNANDVRYYMRRVAYKAGAYYNREYFVLDGKQVHAAGVTIGATFPISNQNAKVGNGLSFSIDIGQRGSPRNDLVRERFINFTIGLSAFDIWFQKNRYL